MKVEKNIQDKVNAGFNVMLRGFGRAVRLRVYGDPTDYDPDLGTYTRTNTEYALEAVITRKQKTRFAPEFLPDFYYKVMVKATDIPDGVNPKIGDEIGVVDTGEIYKIIEMIFGAIIIFICKKE
ncbi:MAG: hypothetical protein AMQ22_00195 [Candidatus Methanofastidiosum methylothiophilum]|uniref:Uncharacterized protein n=1 Tax=Candidatus Methanofastidiosum methylothiophilum TaxID=1705564 RepID=A0A150J983_9EURY|nr:MAG: hypothetical protein APG11_00846 [Candidatus Methanofastidiosum methylthiophilus]KYC53524.1 MAG: hypothetical protein AMQ22_00195 [Candidatus Methanofastidiosum methylthiophilus]